MSLADLPQAKWGSGTGRQVILKGDHAKVENAIIESFGIRGCPTIEWVDATEIKVPATADCPAEIMLIGFPNILHPGLWVVGGLTDGRYRKNIADVTLDFDLSTDLWGTEKASQWYVVYALAGNSDTAFTVKAMPFMRVKSQASQVISLGTLSAPATGIGYGFTTDELAGGMIYPLSGASRGLLRTISANNNDNSTGGTITYDGTALTLAAGDWFVVLPPGVNFRFLGIILNLASGDIEPFARAGNKVNRLISTELSFPSATGGPYENILLGPPLATEVSIACFVGGADTFYVGHPSSTDTTGAWKTVDSAGYLRSNLIVGIDNCKLYVKSASSYGITIAPKGYSYPAGCGY